MRTVCALIVGVCWVALAGCGSGGTAAAVANVLLNANGDGAEDVTPSDGDTNGGEAPQPPDNENENMDEEPPPPLPGDPERGESLFKFNCQECHGTDGSGGADSDIRGASAIQVAAAVTGGGGHDEFPGLDQTDFDDVAAFLADGSGS